MDRSSLLNIVIWIKETIILQEFFLLKVYSEQFLSEQILIRTYGTVVCLLIFVSDKTFDCKRNLSIFCSVAVFSGFSVENESILTLL